MVDPEEYIDSCYVVPFLACMQSADLELPVELGGGVELISVRGGQLSEEVLEDLPEDDRYWIENDTEMALFCQYTSWPKRREAAITYPNLELVDIEEAIQRIQLAAAALWLAKPSTACYYKWISLLRNGDRYVWHHLMERQGPKPYYGVVTEMTRDDVTLASRILNTILARPRSGSVWIAIGFFLKALSESSWDSKYLFLWIAVEALFGPSAAGEVKYRLTQRAAYFLEDAPSDRWALYTALREGYDLRSAVAHGLSVSSKKGGGSKEKLSQMESVVSESLRRILSSPDIADVFWAKTRDHALDRLVMGMPQDAGPKANDEFTT